VVAFLIEIYKTIYCISGKRCNDNSYKHRSKGQLLPVIFSDHSLVYLVTFIIELIVCCNSNTPLHLGADWQETYHHDQVSRPYSSRTRIPLQYEPELSRRICHHHQVNQVGDTLFILRQLLPPTKKDQVNENQNTIHQPAIAKPGVQLTKAIGRPVTKKAKTKIILG
jgi:hypothetical protein